jgi:hypothetical protein
MGIKKARHFFIIFTVSERMAGFWSFSSGQVGYLFGKSGNCLLLGGKTGGGGRQPIS